MMLSVLGSFLISGVLIGLLIFRPVPSPVGDLENIDFTLDVRFLKLEPRRRKSVRKALFSGWYIGSETVAATLPKSLLACRNLRRRPIQMIASTDRRMPRSRPGKNPARMATAGNLSQDATAVPFLADGCCDALLLRVWLGAFDDEAADVGLADEADGVNVDAAADEELLALIMHCWFWHVKPFGQQALPHFSKLPPKSVLCNGFEG